MRATEVFSNDTLANLLAAVALTADASSDAGPHAAAYRRGFAAAIAAVAVAVGIAPADLTTRLQPFDGGRLSEVRR